MVRNASRIAMCGDMSCPRDESHNSYTCTLQVETLGLPQETRFEADEEKGTMGGAEGRWPAVARESHVAEAACGMRACIRPLGAST
jgi:hypothetical protein